MPEKPLRRKRLDPAAAQQPAALALYNTYVAERGRRDGQRICEERAPAIGRFAEDFGQLQSRRDRQASEECAEDHLPGRTPVGASADVWLRLARFVLNAGLAPEEFIRAQFAALSPEAAVPQPAAFLAPEAVKAVYAARRQAVRDLRVALDVQRQRFEALAWRCLRSGQVTDSRAAWAWVLADPQAELSALFRYCLAWSVAAEAQSPDADRFWAIVRRFERPAAVQFVCNAAAYQQVWDGLIPQQFPARARELYFQVHGSGAGREEETNAFSD